MDPLLLVVMLVINLGISFWNAKVCGESWIESKTLGGFIRLLVWCSAIQSAIGFSMIIMVIIVFVAQNYIPEILIKHMISLWYLTIIIPALGTGFIIMIYSWVMAFRERSLANMGTATWNTFAMSYNTYNAVSGISDSFNDVVDGLFSGDSDNKGVMLVIILVIVALFGGILLTSIIIKHYSATLPISRRI